MIAFSSASRRSRVSSRAASRVVPNDSQAAAHGDRYAEADPGRKTAIGPALWAMAVLCLSALCGFSAAAQTAHAGATIILGSGFNLPRGVAVDGSGNVFVADEANNAVKEILAADGSIQTLGSGLSGPAGVAVDGSGNVFVANYGSNAVEEILAAGGYTTVIPLSALSGGFDGPEGVAVDGSGNVFVADTLSSTVKEILAADGSVRPLGSGFFNPGSVAVDGSGNIFVADTSNNAVEEILAADGSVRTLGSGFNLPYGVAVDGNGNVFVADGGSNTVKEIVAAGGYTTVTTPGSGFSLPVGVAVDRNGNIFVADLNNNAVKEILPQRMNFGPVAINTGTPPTLSVAFTFDTAGTIGAPKVLTQGVTGLDFADAGAGDTCTAGATFNAGDTCTLNVSFTPKFSGVRYGAVTLADSSGAVIATAYVYGTGTGPQVTFSPATKSTLGGFNLPIGFFNAPISVAVDGSGNVFVADQGNNAVEEILAAGGYTTVNTLAQTNGNFQQSSSRGGGRQRQRLRRRSG